MAPPLSQPLRAVLFDWGDTLFHAPHAADVIVSFSRSAGVAVSDTRARELWDEIWLAGKTPEEIAKGRDLSMEAHRRVWVDLFSRLDAVVPGLSRALYEIRTRGSRSLTRAPRLKRCGGVGSKWAW